MVVNRSGIEIVLPSIGSESLALRFYEQHREWAEQQWVEMAQKAERIGGLRANRTLPWRGVEIPLEIATGTSLRASVVVGNGVQILLPARTDPAAEEAVALTVLYRWTCAWLRREVATLAERHAEAGASEPRGIRIKSMRTRWGSCGPHNDLNINWLLAFAPPAVLDYVVVHELCHIRERNHSPAFWSLVAERCPEWKLHRRWLRDHGAALMQRFG